MPIAASHSVQIFSGHSASRSEPVVCWILGLALVWTLATTSHAQTQASCTDITFFSLSAPHTTLFPYGINDFETVVGGTTTTPYRGFIRWANGGLTFANGVTSLVDRNDSGVSIGYNGTQNAIILSGSTVKPISVTIGLRTYKFLNVEGINNWGSIVGYYTEPTLVSHGFKRWRENGTGFRIDYPARFHDVYSGTFPTAINDNGTIVGYTQLPFHGFIYHNGLWANLVYPGANQTMPEGITNDNIIVGNSSNSATGTATAFLYKNGVFKAISLPNTTRSIVIATSLKTGLILGIAYSNSFVGGEYFIAKCD